MIKNTLQKSFSFLKNHEKLSAALLFIAVICIIYSPIVFFNKSLQPPLFYPLNGVVETGAYGYEGRIPVNSFNIDMTSGVYVAPPLNRFIGDNYKRGELSLWTPYQASGTPLPEQYGTATFFPFSILKNIFPTKTWDFFILVQFWIAGFFTYLFLRLLKLSPISSFLGGLFFMFSGSFTWFWANEQMTNAAMLIPVLLWALERLFQNQRANPIRCLLSNGVKDIVLSAIIFAFVLLVGNPGGFIFTLLIAGVYFVFRVITIKEKAIQKLKYILLLLFVLVLAIELAAIQILPFIESFSSTLNNRDPRLGYDYGTLGTNWRFLPYIFAPGASEVLTDYRTMPYNGVWDHAGGYTGILSILLIVLGAILFRFSDRKELRKHFFFFLIFGLFILLKNFGVPPFTLLGKLPLFNMTWSPRWAAHVWMFSFAAAGAIGFEFLRRLRVIKLKVLVVLALFFLILFGVLIFFTIKSQGAQYSGIDLGKQFSVFSLGINWPVAILTLIIATWLIFYYIKTGKGLVGLFLLAVFELWFWVPRGYNNLWQVFELILFLIGLTVVIIFALRNKWRYALVGLAVFFLLFSIVDLFAPNGYPQRYDPLTKAPYIDFLQKQNGYFRVVGADGVLMPNLSNVFKLQDIRYIHGTSIKTWHYFSFNNLRKYKFHEDFLKAWHLWFTGMPLPLSTGSLACQNFLNDEVLKEGDPISRRLEQEIRDRLPMYSLLGVKYILMPKSKDMGDSYFPLIYDKEIKIFENPKVFPRAFVANQIDYVSSWQDAQDKILEPDFDLRNNVLLEEKIPSDCCKSPNPENNSSATIKDYKNNEVVIEVSTENPGILVLSDVFYPGWEAKIDNQPAKIYRVGGLLRGVYLEPGNHTVVFKYSPEIFKIGALLTLMALLSCGVLLIFFTPQKSKIKKIILFIVIFILLVPGFYLYSKELSRAWPSFHGEKKIVIPKEELEIELFRQEIISFITENISQILPSELKLSENPSVNRFLFVKDSYKEVYVEYSHQDIKRKILVNIVGYEEKKLGRMRLKDLAKYLLFNYYEFEEGRGWRFREEASERLALDFEKWGIYDQVPLKILTYVREYQKNELELILYITTAYFEPGKDGWKLIKGNDDSVGKDLELYEYGCEEDGAGGLKWVKSEAGQ